MSARISVAYECSTIGVLGHFSNPSVYPEQVRQDVTVLSHSETTAVETAQGVGSYRKEITFALRGK